MNDLRPSGVLEHSQTLPMKTSLDRISPSPQATTGHPTGLLQCLRALTPDRRPSHIESLRVAKHQADLLRRLLNVTTDNFPDDQLEHLPRIRVEYVENQAVPASCTWADGHWRIQVSATLPTMTRRELILHEIKHILDYPQRDRVEDGRAMVRDGERELVADYFAACCLIPEQRLRKARTTSHRRLAHRFDVDLHQLAHRLSETGLTATLSPERRTS